VNAISALAIDAGTHESGYAVYMAGGVLDSGVLPNEAILDLIRASDADLLAIEKIVSYGKAVGQETFDTCVWMGRMAQCWPCPDEVVWVPRMHVKKHFGLKGSATDAMVNTRVREVVGDKGTKANPGPTYGVKSHAWSALAVAVTAIHLQG
jgi:hypothetical protein